MRICPDGLPFVLPPATLGVLLLVAGQPAVAVALLLAAAVIAAFFRDPDRVAAAADTDVVSPADGRVLAVHPTDAGGVVVAIFLSLLDVHVARSPVGGDLRRCRRRPGGYAAAQSAAAAHHARVQMDIESPAGPVRLCLMAGLVARRVLPWVRSPADLHRGQRIAIIRFGSRAEITLPPGHVAAVRPGDRVRAGQTVLAHRTVGGVRG